MKALICWGLNFLPSIVTVQSVPMWRLTERIVRSTLVTACRFATSPTRTSAFLANATTDGVVREPSALAMTVGSPPSRTATTELVVPRSIPTARAMESSCCCTHVEPIQLKFAAALAVRQNLSPTRSTFLQAQRAGLAGSSLGSGVVHRDVSTVGVQVKLVGAGRLIGDRAVDPAAVGLRPHPVVGARHGDRDAAAGGLYPEVLRAG